MTLEKTNWDYHWKSKINKYLIKLNIKGNYYLNYLVYKYLKDAKIAKGSLLEIGSGSGKLASLISNVYRNIFLLDKSKDALELSRFVNRGKKNISFISADIFKFEPLQKFDAVVSLGLLEHFDRVQMFNLVDKHMNLANDGGLVLIGVPAYTPFHIAYAKRNISHYGYQDMEAEFVIEKYLQGQGYEYEKRYLDYLNSKDGALRIFTYLNYLFFFLFKIDLNRLFPNSRGYFVVFRIGKF